MRQTSLSTKVMMFASCCRVPKSNRTTSQAPKCAAEEGGGPRWPSSYARGALAIIGAYRNQRQPGGGVTSFATMTST